LEIDTGALEVYELAFEAGVAMETLAELVAAPLFYQRCAINSPDEGRPCTPRGHSRLQNWCSWSPWSGCRGLAVACCTSARGEERWM